MGPRSIQPSGRLYYATVLPPHVRRQLLLDYIVQQGGSVRMNKNLWEALKENYRRRAVQHRQSYTLGLESDLLWLEKEAYIYGHTASGERGRGEPITWAISS